MADNKRFTVKTGLQAQDLYLESPNKTKNITVSMLNTGVISFNTNSNQVFTVTESGTATLGGRTITLGGNISTANSFTTSGNFATTLTTTAATNVTLPTSGTLMTTGGSGASGTWSIDITGNANTATIANTVTNGVYTTGNQTIGGIKTFSANSVFNGNVGISTDAPAVKLDVRGDGLIQRLQSVTSTDAYLRFEGTGTTSPFIGIVGGVGSFGNVDANPITFKTNALERMRIDAAGNLGLGVTPSAWGVGGKAIEFGTGNAIFSGSVGFSAFYLTNNAYFDGTSWIYKNTQTSTLYAQNFGYHQWFRAPSGTAGNPITFTQAMTLDTSGNLSVGSVTGNRAGVDQGISVEGATTSILESNVNGSRAGYLYSDATTTVVGEFRSAPLSFRTGNDERLRISATGTIFIPGVTTETKSVEIGTGRTGDGISHIDLVGDATYGDYGARFIRNGGPDANTQIQHRGTGGLRLETAEAAPIVFSTTSIEQMAISANGNVGIGTTAPGQKLEVVGSIYLNNGVSGEGINMNGGNAIWRASGGMSLRTSNGERMRIDSTGNVGIGTNLPTTKLHVVGTARVTEELQAKVINSTNGIMLNARAISSSYTITANNNAMSAGPIEIASGITVTILDNARWVVI